MSEATKIHLQNEAAKMIADWEDGGFNGVQFADCHMQLVMLDDFESDGKTKEEWEKHTENFASFIADPDFFELIDDVASGPYVSVELRTDQFELDIISEIKRRLGNDIEITQHDGCSEYEIQRKVNDEQVE